MQIEEFSFATDSGKRGVFHRDHFFYGMENNIRSKGVASFQKDRCPKKGQMNRGAQVLCKRGESAWRSSLGGISLPSKSMPIWQGAIPLFLLFPRMDHRAASIKTTMGANSVRNARF